MTPPASLLLVGGEVLDPGQGIRGRLDVALRDGRVAAVGRDLPQDGYEVLDVAGRLVLPGLIDQHAHCFIGAWDLGVQKRLPPFQREVVLLSRFAGLDHEEIAHVTGASPAAVRVALHRGLRRLRDFLGPM